MSIDLNGITWSQMLLITLVVAAVDTLSGIFGAIAKGTFSLSVVADYIRTHVLQRVFPIVGLSFISQTLPGTTGTAVWAVCLLSLAAYVAETISSVSTNVGPAPADGTVIAGSPS